VSTRGGEGEGRPPEKKHSSDALIKSLIWKRTKKKSSCSPTPLITCYRETPKKDTCVSPRPPPELAQIHVGLLLKKVLPPLASALSALCGVSFYFYCANAVTAAAAVAAPTHPLVAAQPIFTGFAANLVGALVYGECVKDCLGPKLRK
jgi:hypothetical protein